MRGLEPPNGSFSFKLLPAAICCFTASMLSVRTAVWRSISGALALDVATVVAESEVAALFLPPHAVIISEARKRVVQTVNFAKVICFVSMEFELNGLEF